MKNYNGRSRASHGSPIAALKHRNFRYFWFGMIVSTIGTWMQNTAQPWLAYKLTNSAFQLALVSALQFLPVLLFSLFAGVFVDRFNKKKILFFTQSVPFIIILALAILDATGKVVYWHLLVTSTLMGLVNTIDMPARQSFVIELVCREDLSNGIALNSAQFNLSRVLGPAFAGIIMAKWGTAACFFINAVSFGAVVISLFFIKPDSTEKAPIKNDSIFAEIIEGLKFIRGKQILLMPLLFLTVAATFGMNFNVLIPVFSVEVLFLKETGFGLLMSMAGFGALAGAVTMAVVSKGGPMKIFLFVFPFIASAFIILIGLTNASVLTGAALSLASFFHIIFMASVNTTIQLNSTNEFRGRVMSVYSLVVAGSTPIGNLFAGAVANRFGAQISLIACGGVIIVMLMPLYLMMKNGDSMQTVTEM